MASTTASYEVQVNTNSRASLLAQLTAQGSRGFNYFGPYIVGGNAFNFYTKDSNTTYTFEVLDAPTTAPTFLSQLNAQGAKGFDLWGPTTEGSIYIKESDATTFSYEVLPQQTSAAAFLTQANTQGEKGFIYVGPYIFGSIYSKSASSSAKYTYRLGAEPTSHDALLTQANAQGQEGYKFSGQNVFSGETTGAFRNIYVKDTTQASKFEWKSNASATSSANLVTQANTEGAAGYVYWFSVIIGTASRELYFKPTSCSGVLCRSTSPL